MNHIKEIEAKIPAFNCGIKFFTHTTYKPPANYGDLLRGIDGQFQINCHSLEGFDDYCDCSKAYPMPVRRLLHLGPVETEIIDRLINSEVVNVDETGMRIEAKRQWLHVASTKELTHYKWHPKRGSSATDEIGILPQIEGILVHDFWKTVLQMQLRACPLQHSQHQGVNRHF